MNFDTFLATELNAPQRQAVTQPSGSILVIAGAGSGKTRIITARITHLIVKQAVNPSAIVALTFTNKAAQEMRSRVTHFMQAPTPGLFVGTFHSYCLRLLREYGHLIDLTHFSIIDEADQEILLKKIVTKTGAQSLSPRQAAHAISLIKNSDGIEQQDANAYILDVYHNYEREKTASNCLDFDDLLLKVLELFDRNADFAHAFHQRIRHILVDEYQDTNVVQHKLLKKMAIVNNKNTLDSLCIVGDEDQAIYSWRGATVENIVHFDREVADTTIITIEQNYRSVKPILDAANHLITHNSSRHPKKLWSNRPGANCIAHLMCASEYQEAELVARYALTHRKHTTQAPLAILYRTHFQSRALEEALLRHSIPYVIIGGIRFYDRKEIKDLLAYVRLIVNPFDRIAWARAINCPSRKLGEKFSDLFESHWNQQPFATFIDITHKLLATQQLKPQQHKNLQDFLSVFENLDSTCTISVALELIVERTRYVDYLNNEYDSEDAHERVQNVKELLYATASYANTHESDTVEFFLQEIMLMQEQQTKTSTNSAQPILLMTLHAAKGLEFDTVIITGLESGLLPSAKSLGDQANLEEERRLLYVGITRAQNKLLLLQAENRHIFGTLVYQTPSPFLAELPSTIIHEQCSYWSEAQLATFCLTFFTGTLPASTPARRAEPLQSQKVPHWKKYQAVKHSTFGIGVIQEIEERSDNSAYLTIQFKQGTKRIASSFVTSVT